MDDFIKKIFKYQNRRPSENGERGRLRGEHVLIAEKILGKKLPPRALVHHIDGNGKNNRHDNLVICPSTTYHKLIHQRQRAFDACGHADWMKCPFCKEWDLPANMYTYIPKLYRQPRGWHNECSKEYQRKRTELGIKANRDGSRGGQVRG